MAPIEIKILARCDANVLLNVAPEVFDDPIDPRAAKGFLADLRHHIAVAVEDDLVVGFASAVHYVHPDKPRPELWINEVGVAPTHQGRGLGKALLGALFEVGRRMDCAEAWVLTDRGNRAATALYSSCGGTQAADDAVMYSFPLDDDG